MEPISSTSTTDPATTGSAPKSQAQEQKNQFLQLLVAQLKGQNPLDPMDGSEFVAQLAQFSSLEELIKISGSMDKVQALLSKPETTSETTSQGTPFASSAVN